MTGIDTAWAIIWLIIQLFLIVGSMVTVGFVGWHRLAPMLRMREIKDGYKIQQLEVAKSNEHQLFVQKAAAELVASKRLLLGTGDDDPAIDAEATW